MANRTALRRFGGFSLVEVLVTLLLLCIAVLGIASLQASAVRGARSAYFRSQAAILARQMVDTVRANPRAALNGYYATGFEQVRDCDTGARLATCDLARWKRALVRRLPGGAGSVRVDEADHMVTVCIRWSEPTRRRTIATVAEACGAPPRGVRQVEIQTVL